jgi:hypothetical protein
MQVRVAVLGGAQDLPGSTHVEQDHRQHGVGERPPVRVRLVVDRPTRLLEPNFDLAAECLHDTERAAQRPTACSNPGRPWNTGGMDESKNVAGTRLTCSNPDCGCELQINAPCPHGGTYTCACGHPLEPVS